MKTPKGKPRGKRAKKSKVKMKKGKKTPRKKIQDRDVLPIIGISVMSSATLYSRKRAARARQRVEQGRINMQIKSKCYYANPEICRGVFNFLGVDSGFKGQTKTS